MDARRVWGMFVSGRGVRRRQPVFVSITEKRCFACGQTKPLAEFGLDNSTAHRASTYCRECDRERGKAYYAANRERILAKAAEKRGPQPARFCSECGVELEGRQRLTCGSGPCRDARLKRENPEAYAKREAAKVERRREARRRAREAKP
jgi:hypothetical protein